MSDTTTTTQPRYTEGDLDKATADLGRSENQLILILAALAEKHIAMDEEAAPRIHAQLEEIQRKFDTVREMAEAVRPKILRSDRKSARRTTGLFAWRNGRSVVYERSDEELVELIKGLGGRFSRRLLRTVPSRVLDRNACKLSTNDELVRQVAGMRIDETESFSVTPHGGFTISSNERVTRLEGVPLPGILAALYRQGEE